MAKCYSPITFAESRASGHAERAATERATAGTLRPTTRASEAVTMDFAETPEHEMLREAVRGVADGSATSTSPSVHPHRHPHRRALAGDRRPRLPRRAPRPRRTAAEAAGSPSSRSCARSSRPPGCPLLLILVSAAICAELDGRASAPTSRPHLAAAASPPARRWRSRSPSPTPARTATTSPPPPTRDGDIYRLRGTKTYISGRRRVGRDARRRAHRHRRRRRPRAPLAVHRRHRRARARPHAHPGRDHARRRSSSRCSSTTCRSRADRLLGEEDEGLRQVFVGLNPERIIGAAICTGIGRYALDRGADVRAATARCGACRSRSTRASRTRSRRRRSSSSSRA